jgi:hypothetical protein
LHALLRRQLREDFLGRLLVYVGWEVQGHLLISGSRLLIGDRQGSLPEAVDEVLVVLARGAKGLGVGETYVTIAPTHLGVLD